MSEQVTIFCLTVVDVPRFEQLPDDTTVEEGGSAVFRCVASGDGDITVSWEKQDGSSNQLKWSILANNTLRIDKIDVSDKGVYVCKAENEAGSAEAVAHLTVECKFKGFCLPKFI